MKRFDDNEPEPCIGNPSPLHWEEVESPEELYTNNIKLLADGKSWIVAIRKVQSGESLS